MMAKTFEKYGRLVSGGEITSVRRRLPLPDAKTPP